MIHLGIIGTRSDVAVLVRVLNEIKFSWPVSVFSDRAQRPLITKSAELQRSSMMNWITLLRQQWATHLIVPPQFEYELSELDSSEQDNWDTILPLFKEYVVQYALTYSLVWKLWVLGRWTKNDTLQASLTTYTPDAINLWTTDTTQRECMGVTHSNRHHLMRHAVRTSLRPLRDAGVDTLIPTQWWQLYFQRIVTQQTSWKQIRFHGTDALSTILSNLISSLSLAQQNHNHAQSYERIIVYSTDIETDPLSTQMRLKRILTLWWKKELVLTKACQN